MHGSWEEVPGRELFDTLRRELGQLPFVAEDLGVITPDVEELRDHYGFPGMRVLPVGSRILKSATSTCPNIMSRTVSFIRARMTTTRHLAGTTICRISSNERSWKHSERTSNNRPGILFE